MRTCVTLAVIGMLLLAGVASRTVTATTDSQARVIHFPAERSLGRLSVQDANAVRRIESFHHWIDGTEWEYLGRAKGDVVAAGKRLMLSIDNAQAWRDLSLIWGNGITDAGMDDLVKLAHLRKLTPSASSRLTDAGFETDYARRPTQPLQTQRR